MYLSRYTESIKNADLANSINATSKSFLQKINENLSMEQRLNALLLGNVQSGKTGQMLGVMSAMADEGYRFFIMLTTDNIDLQRQTYTRVKENLRDFNVLDEKEDLHLSKSTLVKPTVVILKKNASVLSRWKNLLLNTGLCRGMILVIFDDEADSSSLNTLINKHRVSTINRKLTEIKSTAANTIYIEVTATPQAVLLQTNLSGWKPQFVYYFKPGKDYLGGNYFYPQEKSLNTIYTPDYELDEVVTGGDVVCPWGLRRSILSFLINCAHKKLKGESNCNFMIHPSIKINIHNEFVTTVQEHLTLLQNSTGEKVFVDNLKEEWRDLQQTKPDLENFEDIKNAVVEILDNTEVFVIPLNSKSFVCRDPNNPDALDLKKGFNIVIGGNTLGRGLTFPNLQTVYYCRTSKTPQADTFWQHSRIFGYDREKQMVRIFIPENLYKLFSNLNISNEMLISQIEGNTESIQLIYPINIIPTRKNVIDNEYLNLIYGGCNMFASRPLGVNVGIINRLIEHFSSDVVTDVDTDFLIKLLGLVKSETKYDFNSEKFIACLNGLKTQRPKIRCKLIVRVNRDIAKGTGTLLSPNDRALGDRYNKEVVLTMYRIEGSRNKGWDGHPLWIPNIKFPDDCCFYDIDDD